MRGRTNVHSGISLNADTKECVVASGESVVAGDFLNYYHEVVGGGKAYSTSSTYFLADAFILSDGNIFSFNYNYALVYRRTGENTYEKVVEPQLISFPSLKLLQLDDDTFMGIKVQNTGRYYFSATYYVFHYDVDTHIFTVRTDTTETIHIDSETMGVFSLSALKILIPNGENKYKGFIASYNSETTEKLMISNMDIDITGSSYEDYGISVSNIRGYTTTFTTGSGAKQLCCVSKLGNDCYAVMLGQVALENVVKTVVAIDTIEIKAYISINSAGNKLNVLGCDSTDGYINYVYSSNTNVYFKQLFIDTTDISQYVEYEPVLIYEFYKSYLDFPYLYKLSSDSNIDKYFIEITGYVTALEQKTYRGVFDYNTSTKQLSTVYEPTIGYPISTRDKYESSYCPFREILSNGSNYIYMSVFKFTDDQYFGFSDMSIINNVVTTYVEENDYVAPIHTRQFICGVAKQSGTAGQTIEVYIPSV